MKKNYTKYALFAASVLMVSSSAFAEKWYSNNTTTAQTDTNYMNSSIWNANVVPNMSESDTEGTSINLMNDLSLNGTILLNQMWLKVNDKTFTLQDGANLTLKSGIINDADPTTKLRTTSKVVVETGATLTANYSNQGNIEVNGGTANFTGNLNGSADLSGSNLTINSGNVIVGGNTQNYRINVNSGSYSYGSSTNDIIKVSGGAVTSSNNISGTKVTMTGGTFNMGQQNIQNGATFSLFGTSQIVDTTKQTDQIGIAGSTTVINFGGGKVVDFKNIDVNAATLNFGAKDEYGVFRAAVAHTINVSNKIALRPSTWNFNLANSNLITANDLATLKANAFAFAGNEFEVWNNIAESQTYFHVDFSNMNFSSLVKGDYYVSFIAADLNNYHKDKEPIFDFVNADGDTVSMLYDTIYNYNDDVSVKVMADSSNKLAYYMAINVVPEPSTYAAIFGAIALAFVAYRKKRA